MASEKIDIWNNWRDHSLVTDVMVRALKKECGCQPYEGLMDISREKHKRVLGELPEGAVCWLKVDKRLPRIDKICINRKKIVYTSIYGERIHIQPDPTLD